MPPISPMKDGATRKIVKSATLTPLRTLELNEVYQLITANKRLITLTQAIREAALQGDDNNCRMLKQNRGRSILVTTPAKVLIENNYFHIAGAGAVPRNTKIPNQ